MCFISVKSKWLFSNVMVTLTVYLNNRSYARERKMSQVINKLKPLNSLCLSCILLNVSLNNCTMRCSFLLFSAFLFAFRKHIYIYRNVRMFNSLKFVIYAMQCVICISWIRKNVWIFIAYLRNVMLSESLLKNWNADIDWI